MTHHIKGLDGTFTIARNSHGLYKRRARSSQSGGRSVWIGSWDDGGCLPASITERDLFATFEKYGPLQKVALWRGGDLQEGDPHWLENVGSHAWALYEDRNHAQDAIENEHGQVGEEHVCLKPPKKQLMTLEACDLSTENSGIQVEGARFDKPLSDVPSRMRSTRRND